MAKNERAYKHLSFQKARGVAEFYAGPPTNICQNSCKCVLEHDNTQAGDASCTAGNGGGVHGNMRYGKAYNGHDGANGGAFRDLRGLHARLMMGWPVQPVQAQGRKPWPERSF